MWFLFAFLSGFGGAILAVIMKLYLKNINTFFISFVFFVIASLLMLAIGLYTNKINHSLISSLTSKDSFAIFVGGIVNACAFSCYLYALNCGNVCSVVAIDRLGILYVLVLSVFILNQAFTIKAVIGGLLMIIGAFLLS
jgi:uncharacterized membrane protein